MRRILILALAVGASHIVAGCGDESPTELGAGLIGEGVRTFQVLLEPADFLAMDTTFDEIGDIRAASFRMVAHEFEGELEAHTLFTIRRPFQVTYTDPGGVSRTDSLAAIRGARVRVVVDTLGVTPDPVELEVRPLLEEWDGLSATWDLRVDTTDAVEPWSTPGGTAGEVAAVGQWQPGTDTMVIEIDSASAAVWHDTTQAQLGAMVRARTPGARLRIRSVEFSFDVVPVLTPDTVVSAGSVIRSTMLVTPPPPAAAPGELRVGGLPIWRSIFRLRPLHAVRIPCRSPDLPGADPGCTLPLGDATINLAALVLTPVPAGPHRLEVPIALEGRAVLTAENVPISRSPLTGPIAIMEQQMPTSFFAAPTPPGSVVTVPLTPFVRRLAEPDREDALPWLAVTSQVEGTTFGFAAFASMESATPPRLRLIVTIPAGDGTP